jgi:hypothetical protein
MNRTDLNVAPGQDANRQEQAWESEGGALVGGSDARRAGDHSARSVPVQDVDAGVLRGGDRPMTGTITDLRSGGFGFIASAAYGTPWQLSCRRPAPASDDDGFVRPHVGQRVRFGQEAMPGGRGQHAVGVIPLD